MKKFLFIIVVILTAFVSYEYYLFLNPIKYEFELDSNGDKVYGCRDNMKCPFGSYCGTTYFGKDLPGFARDCRLFIKFKK